jgi:outer membrane receptor protein involved in Fe transport
MKSRHHWPLSGGLVVVVCLLAVLPASGQTPVGAIEGLVKDSSGGVLPGVTVEVTSPALIERIRTTVTDNTGNYRILRLPVGEYAVKFSLAGFTTVERSNIIVNSGFTATINAELKVGQVAETLTVTGESPVVDVRTTTTQTILTDKVIESIPSARNVFDMTKFVIGSSTSTPDVGGSTSQLYTAIQVHGSRGNDRAYYRDGINLSHYFGDGDAPHSYGSTGAQEEVNYQTTAIPASVSNGGMVINMVSKAGGNRVSGSLFASGANKSMQSSNLDDELKSRGVRATAGAKKAYDIDGSIGGPLKKDKVWFFGSARVYSFNQLLANQFSLDGSQAFDFVRKSEYFGKGTWQLNKDNKLTVSLSHELSLRPYRREGATFVMPEAANYNITCGTKPFNHLFGATWMGTRGDAWLFEATWAHFVIAFDEVYRPEVGADDVARLDIVTSVLWSAPIRIRRADTYRNDFTASVTRLGRWLGNHELKAGAQMDFGAYKTVRVNHGDIILRFSNGAPNSVDLINTPVSTNNTAGNVGLYVQDSWTAANRLTVYAGIRYDQIRVAIGDQYAAAGTWVPERRTSETPVQTWRNVVPRLGVAYDLFGTGRTVLKGSFSKYMGVEATGLAETLNPLFWATNRCTWTDTNGDLYAQASEISRCQGWTGGVTTTIDPDLRRPFNREYSAGIQHELAANLGVSVMYYRRENRDLRGTRNLAVPTDSYIPVAITNPLSAQPLTIYNQDPAAAGLQRNLLTNSSKLNTSYNGIEFTLQRRFSPQVYVLAGYHYGKALGRITTGELNDPNDDIFTDGAVGNDEPHQFKLSGGYLLPGKISVSGFLSMRSGHPRAQQLVVGRALVPNLTRSSQTVRLQRNDEERYDPVSLLDLRFGRPFKVGRWEFEPFVDAYNVLNVNTVLTSVATVGPSLGQVSATVNPRLIRVGGKVNF